MAATHTGSPWRSVTSCRAAATSGLTSAACGVSRFARLTTRVGRSLASAPRAARTRISCTARQALSKGCIDGSDRIRRTASYGSCARRCSAGIALPPGRSPSDQSRISRDAQSVDFFKHVGALHDTGCGSIRPTNTAVAPGRSTKRRARRPRRGLSFGSWHSTREPCPKVTPLRQSGVT